MKISIRFLLKETFGCFLHHWFMTMVCVGLNLFSGVTIMIAGLTMYPPAVKLIQHMRTKHPLMAFLGKKIGNVPLDSTQLIVMAILVYLFSCWVVNTFLFRTNSTICNEKITLKKHLITALKMTPRFLLVSLVKFFLMVVSCVFIFVLCLTSGFLTNDLIMLFLAVIMIFLTVISLVAGLVLLIRLALADAIIINQQCSGFAALRRSWQLTKGQWLPILAGISLPIFLINKWWCYLFSHVYTLHLYQQLTGLPTVKLQQSSRAKDVHR